VLRELGHRDERVVNRDGDGDRMPWRAGGKLSHLVFWIGRRIRLGEGRARPKPGDVLYLAPPEHACILEHLDEERGRVATFDDGLWDDATNKPAGRARESTFAAIEGWLRVGARVLRGWLDVARRPGLLAE
jgi:hypothetical protein